MNNKGYIRLEEFRQLKNKIRSSEDHLIVGIDVAKNKHYAFFGNAKGQTLLRRLIFENNLEGFRKLLDYSKSIMVKHALKAVVFGLEPTANYHKPLAEYLLWKDQTLVLVAGEAISKNRVLLSGRWDSNDTKDCANVADLISQGKCLFYEKAAMPLRELRNLLSLKRRFKKQEHGMKVRIRNHLIAQYFPEMDRYFGPGGKEMLSIVRYCLSPAMISELSFGEFVKRVAPRDRGIRQREKLKRIWDLARDSIGCQVGKYLGFEANIMVEGMLRTTESIKIIDEQIKDICLQFPEYEYLLTIPGFGPDISSKVLAAIGNPYRFKNRHQVLRIAGLDLSAKRSGERSQTVVPIISKKGKADLRYALYQAAFVASTLNRHFMVYFTNKLQGREKERGIRIKRRVKLAAKMLIIAWTLMKKKESFDLSYLKIE